MNNSNSPPSPPSPLTTTSVKEADKILFHLGYPKTASTWLQKYIFEAETDKFLCPWGARAGRAIDHFVLHDGFAFDPEPIRLELAASLKTASEDGTMVVISEETLVGDICSRKYWGPETVRRIHETFPRARIFLCIREQHRMIYSAYGEYVRHGGILPLRQFIKSNNPRAGTGPFCRPDALLYHNVIEFLHDIFGEDSVLVLPTELLKSQAKVFREKLFDFTGFSAGEEMPETSANVGMGPFVRSLARKANYFRLYDLKSWPFILRSLDKLVPDSLNKRVEKKHRAIIAEEIGQFYVDSNRRTSELISMDLRMFGYST